MLTLKWKLYRISNYLLLASSTLLFLKSLDLSMFAPDKELRFISFSVGLIFLSMTTQSVINLVIMAKTFPDKLLIHGKRYWHTFATVCNALSFFALFYMTFFELLPEIGTTENPYDKSVIITVAVLLFLMINSVFVLFCQRILKRVLQRNNESVASSMIDTIGKE